MVILVLNKEKAGRGRVSGLAVCSPQCQNSRRSGGQRRPCYHRPSRLRGTCRCATRRCPRSWPPWDSTSTWARCWAAAPLHSVCSGCVRTHEYTSESHALSQNWCVCDFTAEKHTVVTPVFMGFRNDLWKYFMGRKAVFGRAPSILPGRACLRGTENSKFW